MTSPIQGLISPTTGLFPALREIVGRSEQDDGILRIEDNDEITGDVALSQGRYITGAYESSTGTKGVQALTKLLAVRKGSFKFIPISNGFDSNLQQTLKLDVKKLVSEEEAEHAPEGVGTGTGVGNAAANSANKATDTGKDPTSPTQGATTKSAVGPDTSPNNRGVMIPQFSDDSPAQEIDRSRQKPAASNDKDAGKTTAVPHSDSSKPGAIHVSKTRANMDGHFVYADMEEEDDLFSLLEHFGLSVEQPIVERLYETDEDSSPASLRGPTADIMRRAAARLNPTIESQQDTPQSEPSVNSAQITDGAQKLPTPAEPPRRPVEPTRPESAQISDDLPTPPATAPESSPLPENSLHPNSVQISDDLHTPPATAPESSPLPENSLHPNSVQISDDLHTPPATAPESSPLPENSPHPNSVQISDDLPTPAASAPESSPLPENSPHPNSVQISDDLPTPPASASEPSSKPVEEAPVAPLAETAGAEGSEAQTPVIKSTPPLAGSAATEGSEVGTWAARVLSGQDGESNALVQIAPSIIPPAATSAATSPLPQKAPSQAGPGTTSDTTPSREETWTERVIAAARKAKGSATSENTTTTDADKVAAGKIDVDQSASMRLKFHGKAPQPNLPDRLQKGGANFWSKHRVKFNLACVLVSMLVTSLILERSILSLIYTRKAEERIKAENYGAAMNDIGIALFFDPGQEEAHYAKARVFSKLGQEANALAEYNIVLANDPTKINALERRAAICVTLGDFRQTLDDCNQLLKLQPTKSSVYVFANRGIANYMLGNKEEAVTDFTTALKMKGPDEALLTRRGATYSVLGQFDNAIKDYDTAIKLHPKSAEAYAGRAQCWMRAKKFSNAFADFDRSVRLSPINASLLTQRGASYAITKQYDRASKDFAKALAINPRYAGAYRERARIDILQHHYGAAEADLIRAAQVKTPDSEFYKQRAELYELMDNHAKARDDYSDALSLQPNDIEALIGRARNLSSIGNQRAAMADIDEALKLAPTYSQLYALRGLYGDRYGNTSTAKTDFDKAIALSPRNAEAHLWRGDFLLKQKDFISAGNDFDQALKLNPDLIEAKKNKILAQAKLPHSAVQVPSPVVTHAHPSREDQELLEKGTLPELVQAGYEQMLSGNNERAAMLLEKAVRLNPNDASARRYLAHSFLSAGDTDNAIAQFQMVDKLGPPNADDVKALADALAQTNRTEEAISAYNRCLQMRPNDVKSRCTVARLYAASGFLNKAREVCMEGLKKSSDSAELNVVLKEIQSKAARQRTTSPGQEQRPNTEG